MFTKNLIFCCLLFIASCTSLSYKIKKESFTSIQSSNNCSGKRLRFDLVINTDERDRFEESTANLKRNRFYDSLLFDMRSWKKFKSVHENPTKVNEILLSRLYQDDLSLEITIDEKILDEDRTRILRVLTFGAVPQKASKEVKFEIKLKDLKTGKITTFRKEYVLDMTFMALVILIPYDMNMHPYSIDDQVEIYKNLIISDLKRILIAEG